METFLHVDTQIRHLLVCTQMFGLGCPVTTMQTLAPNDVISARWNARFWNIFHFPFVQQEEVETRCPSSGLKGVNTFREMSLFAICNLKFLA